MKKYRCQFPNCGALLDSPGACEKHKAYIDAQRAKPFANATRTNSALYASQEWRNLRAEVLAENPRCHQCGAVDNLTVHHIIAPRGNPHLFFSKINLIVICAACHRLITAQEIRERKK